MNDQQFLAEFQVRFDEARQLFDEDHPDLVMPKINIETYVIKDVGVRIETKRLSITADPKVFGLDLTQDAGRLLLVNACLNGVHIGTKKGKILLIADLPTDASYVRQIQMSVLLTILFNALIE